MNEQIPQEIDELINLATDEREKKTQEVTTANRENIIKRQQECFHKASEFSDEVRSLIPNEIYPFVKLTDVNIDNVDSYDCSWDDRILEFHVPGLAPFAMVFDCDRHTEQYRLTDWIITGVAEQGWDEDWNLCTTAGFTWNSRYAHKISDPTIDVGMVLLEAKQVADELPKRQTEVKSKFEAAIKAREEREQRERRRIAEEQDLFDAIKNDAIAIHMLKAFVLLRDERSDFEVRLTEADETMYSIENRWSRKAEELRRQAADADRKAEDERARLQSELDDSQAELKKSQRGW